MARLKLKETLMPLLVKPDNEHKPPIPKQRPSQSKGGFSKSSQKNKETINSQLNNVNSLFPCKLGEDTEHKLSALSKQLVEAWGDRQLSNIDLDDRIATAAEKAPTDDNLIRSLRVVLSLVKSEYEKVLIQEEENVRKAGGLHVIGTERHESRRVDNQLRGRAGRQGDLGSTRFFLSLEDNLLRIFGGERVANLMNAFRVDEDMPIESGMLTRSLESAQKKVETYYYDISCLLYTSPSPRDRVRSRMPSSA